MKEVYVIEWIDNEVGYGPKKILAYLDVKDAWEAARQKNVGVFR